MTILPSTQAPQVFLNYRGEQLRNSFVSHLVDAFEKNEIKFVLDKYEQRGTDLKNLFVRIQESRIALAIFSTRYTESSWCLDELVEMKKLADKGKLLVIPIFYKVKTDDVRKPTRYSEFGRNFWKLAEDSSGDQLKKWKEALECISGKMGLSLGDKRSEADFVKDTVKTVQSVVAAIGLEEEDNHIGEKKINGSKFFRVVQRVISARGRGDKNQMVMKIDDNDEKPPHEKSQREEEDQGLKSKRRWAWLLCCNGLSE